MTARIGFGADEAHERLGHLEAHNLHDIAANSNAQFEFRVWAVELLLERGCRSVYRPALAGVLAFAREKQSSPHGG